MNQEFVLFDRQDTKTLYELRHVRSVLLAACAALALAGCGGGSGDSNEPTANLQAPEGFQMSGYNLLGVSFSWASTPGASRYELFSDPDGPGPLAEAPIEQFDENIEGRGSSSLFGRVNYDQPDIGRFDATYRLRACDASGCGPFTAIETPHSLLAASLASESHQFASGYKGSRYLQLSRDGLTLTFRDIVFVRSSEADAWRPQAALSGLLSADGNVMASQSTDGIHMHVRSQGDWKEQAVIDPASAPSACARPCTFFWEGWTGDAVELSDDGSVLAIRTRSGSESHAKSGVIVYVRDGDTWAAQTYLVPDTRGVLPPDDLNWSLMMALSGDGRTLAMNAGTDGLEALQPYVYVFKQSTAGVWSEQARMPMDFVYQQYLVGIVRSSMSLSTDGNTLAISGQLPRDVPVSNDMGIRSLTCGSWENERSNAGSNWYTALFARNGESWLRQANVRASSLILAPDGSEFVGFFPESRLFTRHDGVWTCPPLYFTMTSARYFAGLRSSPLQQVYQ